MGVVENRAERLARRNGWTLDKKTAWITKKNKREGLTKLKNGVLKIAEVGLATMPLGLGTIAAMAIEAVPVLRDIPIIKEVVEENVAIIQQEWDQDGNKFMHTMREILPALRLFQNGDWIEGTVSLVAFIAGSGYLAQLLGLFE